MTDKKVTILYFVYDKRAIYLDDRSRLPLLDKDTNKKKMIQSARAWGGIVLKVTPAGLNGKGTAESSEIVFVHRAQIRKRKSDDITRSELMKKLKAWDADVLARGPPKRRG